jgi:pimeloyl-ACP methyl ester carboxylesterase
MQAASAVRDNGGADATGLLDPAARPAVGAGTARAICLARDGDDLLVMLHEPGGDAARDTAVLLCPSFGWHQDCSYRGLRAWATELARAGYPSARLTLPSTGDSAGSPHDPGRLDAWTAAVSDGVGWLRQACGVQRVVVIGIGLGGVAAYRAVAAGACIDELVLWAVPDRGRALLRELRGHHQIIAAAFPDDIRDNPDEHGDLEFVGYTMSAETAAALSELRLTALDLDRVPRRVLMLGRDGIAPDAKLAERLRASGSEVEAADGQDYAELMANPQQSLAPRRTIGLTLEWLEHRAVRSGASTSAAHGVAAEAEVLTGQHAGIAIRETPLWFDGVRGRIFGVLAEAAAGKPAPVCVVFLGAGALPHTGPNRSWVDLSRTWAARGVSSLRIDFAGVGESDGEEPELVEDESFYDPWRDGEVKSILDQLQQRGVANRFVLGGLCSGAYRSVRRALVDPRVRGLLLLNLYAFEWSHELVAERGRRQSVAHGIPNARGHAIDREFFSKAMGYARPDRAWRLIRRSAEREQKRVVVAALDQLRDQQVQTLLLLGTVEPLLAQFERQGLTEQLHRWPNLTLDRSPSGDHMYRARWLQRHVYATLDAAVDRTVALVDAEPPVACGTG